MSDWHRTKNKIIKEWPVCPTCGSKITWATLVFLDKEVKCKWTCGEHEWLVDYVDSQ